MKDKPNPEKALGKLSSSERELVASVLDDADRCSPEALELARLRLRNIACKYDEQLKRERLATRNGNEMGEVTELQARLELVHAATAAVEARLQEPGASDSGD
ncbi:MAG: hypothetical protein ACNS61_15440 [Candidatus Wenzhouxiangella sp. M2_3B_020]